MCVFGMNCRRGLDCHCGHTDVEKKLFADRKALREKEWMAPCGFCALGRCRYGEACQRSIRSRLSNEAYEKQSAPARATESESDYASAESGSDSSDDSADDADAAKPGCEAEGALSAREVAPFLLEDYTKVIKGWRPRVSTVDVGRGGFGELPVFWVLQIVDVPVLPGTTPVQQSIEDTVNFQFTQSGAAAVSQKTQRCEERQQKLMQSEAANLAWDGLTAHGDAASVREFGRSKLSDTKMPKKFQEHKASQLLDLKWSGPGSSLDMRRKSAATVLQQRTVRRVGAGRCGEGTAARAALFRDSDGDNSGDCTVTVEKAVVDEAMSAQNKARSLSKLQQWEWRKQMLAGWFIKQYARRFAQFCRDVNARRERGWDLMERGGVSMRYDEYHAWMNIGKWVDSRDLPAGNLFSQWVRALPKGERQDVQVAAARQSAATVLRTVLLYRAIEVAQESDLTYLKGSFEDWLWRTKRDIQIRVQDIEWLCVGVMRDLSIWELENAWRQWKFWMGVHRVEEILRSREIVQLRGATRQWYGGLYAEWVKEADANRTAEVPHNWSRVVRKGQVQQWQSEAKQMAAAIKIADAIKGWGVMDPFAVTPWCGTQHCRWNSVVWSLCELMGI